MVKRIGRNANTTDESFISAPISVGSSVSTTLIAANEQRMYLAISVLDKDIWLKFQAASVDNNKRGIFVGRNQMYELLPDNMYTGEISAICDVGTATIYITEL